MRKINLIKTNNNENEIIETSEENMGLLKKHMDKFIIGGLTGVAALLLGCFIASKINPSDEEVSNDEILDVDVTNEFEF